MWVSSNLYDALASISYVLDSVLRDQTVHQDLEGSRLQVQYIDLAKIVFARLDEPREMPVVEGNAGMDVHWGHGIEQV